MRETPLGDGPWTFGTFVLDAAGFQLLDGMRPVRLERLPLELLLILVERRGGLVSRDEIAARLWRDDDGIDAESGIHTAVRKLRAALNDSADRPTFVQTVTGKGYRFIAPVTSTVTIAVLPFDDLSEDPSREHLGDGLTEDIIGSLGRLSPASIRVIARTSIMAYKRTRKTAEEIGRELGARYLLEGTLRRQQGRMRITAKLIRAEDHVQVWGDAYDRSAVDLLTVQQEIGVAVARAAGARLAAAPSVREQDPDAHDWYLRGRYYWYRRSMDAMTKAEQCFVEAIRKAPSFAPAHAGLADTYVIQILTNSTEAVDRWARARSAAETALALDSNLAEAHVAAAMMAFFVGWDWPAAERSFQRAIELNSSSAIAHQFYAHFLSCSLRHDEAIAEIRKARELDPLAPITHMFMGMFLAWAGRHDEALAAVRHAVTIDADFFPARAALGHIYDRLGQPNAALEEYRNAYRLSGGNLLQLGFQGFVLARTGGTADARQIVATLEEIARSRYVPPSAFALIFAGLDERDAAFHHLDRACELRDVFLVMLKCAHWWDSLRSDARFRALLRRCGFPAQRRVAGASASTTSGSCT